MQRSVVGHSPGGHNESDMTKELSMHTLYKGDSLESVSYILSKKKKNTRNFIDSLTEPNTFS